MTATPIFLSIPSRWMCYSRISQSWAQNSSLKTRTISRSMGWTIRPAPLRSQVATRRRRSCSAIIARWIHSAMSPSATATFISWRAIRLQRSTWISAPSSTTTTSQASAMWTASVSRAWTTTRSFTRNIQRTAPIPTTARMFTSKKTATIFRRLTLRRSINIFRRSLA